MALPKLEGQIIISTATILGTFAGVAITIPAGRYYLTSVGSGGATRSLLAEMAFQFNTNIAGVWTVTLTDDADDANGSVIITRDSNFTATWTSATLRDALGFSQGNLTPAATVFSGFSCARYLWLPNCGRAGIMAPSASSGALEADYTIAVATDGTPYPISYSVRTLDSMEFRHVRGKKAWIAHESRANESFERFYRDVIALALRLRFYADRAVDTTYREWVVEDGGRYAPRALDERWADGAECLWGFRYTVRTAP